jgi:predicted dehydrogenase
LKPYRKIKTLLVGLGRIASSLETDPYRWKPCTHAGVLFDRWGKQIFSLEAIYDKNTAKFDDFSQQWDFREKPVTLNKKEYDSVSNLDLDFAIVATTSASHYEVASHLLHSGIRNLLIEKPVALNSSDAKDLLKLAKKNKAKIWINHERRYHSRYQYVRKALQEGIYGLVQSVRANVFTSAKNPGLAFSKHGGGPLLHDGTHAIDLLFWLFGKLNLRYANVSRPSSKTVEDRATAWLKSESGLEVFLDVSGGRDYFQFEIDIFTTKARLILSNDGFELFESAPSKLYKGFKSLQKTEFPKLPKIERSNAFLGIYQEIAKNIHEKSDYQEGTLKDNIDILECIESIYHFRRKK